MDSLAWNNPPLNHVAIQQGLWSNQQHEIGENSNAAAFGIIGGKMDPTEVLLDPGQELQRIKICETDMNSCRISKMVQQLAPDLTNVASRMNVSQHQEAIRLAADTVFAKSGAGTTWGEALTAELCSPPVINRPSLMNPLSGLMVDFGTIKNGTAELSATGSLDSLDCLLSATNSNTDTSVEDDGMSLILSDCRNLWSFGPGSNVSTSGDSENNGSNGSKKETQLQVNEPDEAVSQGSSSPYVNHAISSEHSRPSSNKRGKNQQEFKGSVDFHHFNLHQSDSSTSEGGFQLISEYPPKLKKLKVEKHQRSSNINFQQPNFSVSSVGEPDTEAIAQMKEMIYRAAAFRPVNLGLEEVEKPKRKNIRISTDPQTVAARQRRERISERIRVLQRLVPGGSKMDTASMLDEAANYLKFLRSQVKALQVHKLDSVNCTSTALPFSSLPFNNNPFAMQNLFPFQKP